MHLSQSSLPGFSFSKKLSFGGSQHKSNPKTARPLSTKEAIHVVMRSTRATGQRSFLLHAKSIERILKKQAKACGVNLYDLANAGNHLHMVIRVPSRRLYMRFMRSSSGLIARVVLGKERGRAQGTTNESVSNEVPKPPEFSRTKKIKFWDARPFTRIVAWGKAYKTLKNYLKLNRVETLGIERLSARDMFAKIEALRKSIKLVPLGFGTFVSIGQSHS